MTSIDPNLRKAAVLLRSLDSDTATVMLGQLSAAEAATIRAAMRAIGQVATEEQADVMEELRGGRPAKQNASRGNDVELELSSALVSAQYNEHVAIPGMVENCATSKRFEFLETSPIQALVPHLAREHAQTIAVVLSHLAPQRAAAILAALPQKVQTETIERLSTLGETDPDCVTVLERELAAWATKRDNARMHGGRRRDTMGAILAAADAKVRNQILGNMKDHKEVLAKQFEPHRAERVRPTPVASREAALRARVAEARNSHDEPRISSQVTTRPVPRVEAPLPRIAFDDLIHLDVRTLSAVLRQVDANVLALALVGSREEMVDRVCDQMPKRTAREFRRELRRLGPTRLSDVEAAQQAVAHIAARLLAERRAELAVMPV